MAPFAHFDERSFPVVLITITGEKPDEENFRRYLDGKLEICLKRQPFVFIIDASRSSLIGVTYQQWQADWQNENVDLLRAFCLGEAFVINDPLTRSILDNIHRETDTLPMPVTVVATLREARQWAERQIKNRDA